MPEPGPLSRAVALCALAGLLVGSARAAEFPDPESEASARRGAAYLAGTQGPDGSIPEGGKPAAQGGTAEALVALAAGDQDQAVTRAVEHLRDSARADVTEGENQGPRTGRVVSALVVAGEDPRSFAGLDFVAHLESQHNPVTGSYGGTTLYGDGLAMLGWLAAGEELLVASVNRLLLRQCDDGAWHWSGSCTGGRDTDTTVLAMSALVAARGPGDDAVVEARAWLTETQNPSGCWGSDPTDEANSADSANSCGLVLSTIVALGEDPNGPPWSEGDRRPAAALREFQQESGEFHSRLGSPGATGYATVQAVPGLAGWAYPVVERDAEGGPLTPSSTTTTSPPPGSTTPTTSNPPESPSAPPGSPSPPSTLPEGDGGGSPAASGPTVATAPVSAPEVPPEVASSRSSSPQRGSTMVKTWPGAGSLAPARQPGVSVLGPAADRGALTVRDRAGDGAGMTVALAVAGGGVALTAAGVGWEWRRRRARPSW